MGRSDRKWEFREHSHHLRQHLRRHETLHLQLLGLGNRGIPRRSDGLVGLSQQPADSDLTLRASSLLRTHTSTANLTSPSEASD